KNRNQFFYFLGNYSYFTFIRYHVFYIYFCYFTICIHVFRLPFLQINQSRWEIIPAFPRLHERIRFYFNDSKKSRFSSISSSGKGAKPVSPAKVLMLFNV